jgi:AcrR family transcriptional regulator
VYVAASAASGVISMSRRTEAGDQTRERILASALALFAEHGFAGTSTRMVGEAANVNIATLAYHFGDKQGLYDDVVQRLHHDLSAGVPGLIGGSTPEAMLEHAVRGLWTFARSRKLEIKLLVRHVLDHGNLPDVVVGRWTGPLTAQGDAFVAGFRPEWTADQRRLFLQQQLYTFARFAAAEDDELAVVLPGVTDREQAVVDWLVAQAAVMLGVKR